MTLPEILGLVWFTGAIAIWIVGAAQCWSEPRGAGRATYLGIIFGAGLSWPAALIGAAGGYAVYRLTSRPRPRRKSMASSGKGVSG